MTTKELRGSKTEQILINSFAGESQARNRYTYFAKQAKKEGYEQIAEIFLSTAENEKEHAKLFYEHIGNTIGHVTGSYPFEFGTTAENLKSAISGEHEEWTLLYAEGEKIAQEEGFEDISNTFKYIRRSEEHHEKRFQKLLTNIEKGEVFKKNSETEWICRKCAYVIKGKSAPEKCPNCHHPQGYYEILCEKY